MTRAILSFFGGLFSFIMLGTVFAALTVGGVIWVYTHDLPSTEQLANYEPPMISRVYSGEGQMMDEFARERRLFTPIEDIPPLAASGLHFGRGPLFLRASGLQPAGDDLGGARTRWCRAGVTCGARRPLPSR